MASVTSEDKEVTLTNGAYKDYTLASIGNPTVFRIYVKTGLLKVMGTNEGSGRAIMAARRHDADYQDIIVSGMNSAVRIQEGSNGARGTTIPGLVNKAIYTLETIIP